MPNELYSSREARKTKISDIKGLFTWGLGYPASRVSLKQRKRTQASMTVFCYDVHLALGAG